MSYNLTPINIDKVSQICFETYQKVPKSGKPAVNEWTVLSCILIYDKTLEKIEVVSLGTGTKCVGASKMSSKGDVLNDSHAEAMARRGFLLYLYENVDKALENQKSMFYFEDEQLKLRGNIEFVFYSSHVPCGDAAIVLQEDNSNEDTHEHHKDTDDIRLFSNINSTEYILPKHKSDFTSSMFDDNINTNKIKLQTDSSIFLNKTNLTKDMVHIQNSDFTNNISTNNDSNSTKNLPTKHKLDSSTNSPTKKPKLQSDHRTGAKCLPNSEQDPLGTSQNYHITGQVRTKPGRGPRTLSVSCTDKIARWIHLGIQGSLLTLFIEPIFIKHFIFGGGVPYCEESIKRAFFNRNGTKLELNIEPKFYQSTLVFEHLKSDLKYRPSPASIVWIKLKTPVSQVAIQGKKLGCTKSKANSMNAALCISKYHIYTTFTQVLSKHTKLKEKLLENRDLSTIPYNEMKRKAIDYYENWAKVKETFFKLWTVKPDMWNFCIANK